MKQFTLILTLLMMLLLVGCNNSDGTTGTTETTETLKTTENSDTTDLTASVDTTSEASPLLLERVWDSNHPDDSEKNPHFSVTVDSLDGALIEYKEDYKIYINSQHLIGGTGYGCESFYLSDITGDGKPELCFGMNWGSGIIDHSIAVIDYETKECIFSLSDRMHHDYFLFARSGVLCVMETDFMEGEPTRTGVLINDGGKISVAWDNEVDTSYDKNN